MEKLTKEDAEEIFAALDIRMNNLNEDLRKYGGHRSPAEPSLAEWVRHLRSILNKIGPDGINLVQR